MQPNKDEPLPPLPPPEVKNPCRNPWQQKWLNLDCHHPKIQSLADTAQAFCMRWYRNDNRPSLLVLVGESGCGKTHVADKIAAFTAAVGMKALLESEGWRGVSGASRQASLSWPATTDRFKGGDYSAVEYAGTVGFLMIDDIGAEHDPSKNATDKLCQILSKRETKFTVITTNIKIEDWPEKFDTRIADRLFRNSEIVDLFGVKSYATI